MLCALLAAVFVLSLAGCGSGSASFTWFVDTIPSNLDPQVASTASDVIACENLYSGLVRKDASGKLVPALAEHWEVSPDRRTYTFTLKSGLTYSATKGAIIAFVKGLAKELGPSGIRVNAVAPGAVDTDMLSCFTAEDKAAMAENSALCRIGRPEDIAGVVAFLASDAASFVTGQILGADGGMII